VVRAAPNNVQANHMRAEVLCGEAGAWEAGPRSAAELKEAAMHVDRAELTGNAAWCRATAARQKPSM
jgi:hypothetical protein